MQLEYPFRFDGRRRTSTVDGERHVRDLIEQVLFTQPGERVNRPDFGSGLLSLTFSPLSDEIAAATTFLVRGSLEQWLGSLIAVEDVAVERADGALHVAVSYVVRRTGERRTTELSRAAAVP